MSNNKDDCIVGCGIYTIIFGLISLFVFCFVVLPDIKYVSPWQKVTTFNINMTEVSHRCCLIQDCSCTQLSFDFPNCIDALRTLNQTACGQGYLCCTTVCDTCQECHQESYRYVCGSTMIAPIVEEEIIGQIQAHPAQSPKYCTGYRTICNDY